MAKKNLENRELRTLGNIQFRSNEDGSFDEQICEGYAVVFDSMSEDLGGFHEFIDKGAITEETIMRSDVFATLDHDMSKGVLARSRRGKGSLTLQVTDKGLWYSYTIPNTPLGQELREGIKRGDIAGASFAFDVIDDEWTHTPNGTIRHIKLIGNLYDISSCYSAAYSAATTTVRKLEECNGVIDQLNALQAELDDLAKVDM